MGMFMIALLVIAMALSSCAPIKPEFCGDTFYLYDSKNYIISKNRSEIEDFNIFEIKSKSSAVYIYEGNNPNVAGAIMQSLDERSPALDLEEVTSASFTRAYKIKGKSDQYIFITGLKFPSYVHLYGKDRNSTELLGIVSSAIQLRTNDVDCKTDAAMAPMG